MSFKMTRKVAAATITAALLLSTVPVPAAMAAQAAQVEYGVNFREAASSSSDVIRMLKKGEKLTVLDRVNSYWYKIKDKNGKVGYISTSSKYTDFIEENKSDQAKESSSNALINQSVNFRDKPFTSGDRIRYLKKGEQVSILSQPNKYWYEVKDKNGVRGYVSTADKYITVNGTIPGNKENNSGGGSAPVQSSNKVIESVISAGMKYLGTPYEFGSSRSNTKTFDCSDFVRQAFLDGAGLKLPADSRQQGEFVKDNGDTTSNWRNLKRGDVMFFMSYKGTKKSAYSGVNKSKAKITHDGIYLGDGKILHTYSKDSGGVTISKIEGTHWEHRFLYGGSAL